VDHRARLEWASQHLNALEDAVRIFYDSKPCQIVYNFNSQTREHSAKIASIRAVPYEWSLRASDIVHSLRSSLDNLAYSLAVKHSGAAALVGNTQVQFPVCDTPECWAAEKPKRLSLLSQAAQTEIERLQPCNRIDKSLRSGLSFLRELSNTDKHRHLVLTLVRVDDVSITLSGSHIIPGTSFGGYRGPLVVDAVIGKWSFDPNPTPPDMQVFPKLTLEIQFGAGGPAPHHVVLNLLTFIRNQIRDDVFPALEPYL
jgi:hypothetical protein